MWGWTYSLQRDFLTLSPSLGVVTVTKLDTGRLPVETLISSLSTHNTHWSNNLEETTLSGVGTCYKIYYLPIYYYKSIAN